MAAEAARLKRKNPLARKRKTDLTLTGLLMEGLGGLAARLVYDHLREADQSGVTKARARHRRVPP